GARDLLANAEFDRGLTTTMAEMRRLLGGNLLNLPHRQWLPRRHALQPIFTKQCAHRYAGHMADAAQSVVDGWAGRDPADAVDLDAECRTLTLQALGHSVFGVDLSYDAASVGAAMRTALSWTIDRSIQPVKAPHWLPTPKQRRVRRATIRLNELADGILAGVRADPDRDAPLVRALLEATDPHTGQPLRDDEIRSELVLFLLAGHDTTSTTLTYALWALGRHPELQQQVHEEAAALGDRRLTPQDVPALPRTVEVLHEALRLCPPAATIARTPGCDVEVDGYRIEAGTTAILSVPALHRDPTLWEDPQRFDPDRFLPGRSAVRDRWQYLPFGGGPRTCIGDHFAMLEATLALATVLRAVSVEPLTDTFPLATPFTVVPAGAVPARVRRR
ncbi:MAG TPA: cytochrome P450, partial [Mycobacterium sp.]|nr:cytochrome P450 [Mycobacterium sp.]